MIIEHCCCHRQLPDLIRLCAERVTSFHTNGDVTLEDVFHAAAYKVGQCNLTIITPEVDVDFVRYLFICFSRKWITSLRLLTHNDQSELVMRYLSDYEKKVTAISDTRISESSALMILDGHSRHMAVSGYLPCASPTDSGKPYRMVNHTLLYTESNDDQWKDMTQIPTLPFNIRKK